MADYNEWNCPHGIHAGEAGSCTQCNEDRRRKMVNPTPEDQIDILETEIRGLELTNEIHKQAIKNSQNSIRTNRSVISKKRQQLRNLKNANKNG